MTRFSSKYFRPLLIGFLSVQLALTPMLAYARSPLASRTGADNSGVAAPEVQIRSAILTSPALDQNPFFEQGEQWRNADHAAHFQAFDTYGYRPDGNGFDLVVGGTNREIYIPAALEPVQNGATGDYLFFSARTDGMFRQYAGGGDPTDSGGVFFISKTDLAWSARAGTPVPVYFFALPNDWSGQLSALEDAQVRMLGVMNQAKTTVAIDLHDVDNIYWDEKANLILATAFTVRFEGIRNPNAIVTPMAGMTYDHGLFFVGVNPQDPNDSAFSIIAKNNFGIHGEVAQILNHLHLSSLFEPEKAHAEVLALTAAAIAGFVRVAEVQLVLIALTTYLQYRKPGRIREVLERHKDDKIHVEAKAGALKRGAVGLLNSNLGRKIRTKVGLSGGTIQVKERPGIVYRGIIHLLNTSPGRKLRAWLRIFAPANTSVGQLPGVLSFNGLNFTFDRLLPALSARVNSPLRRFLDRCMFFGRNASKKVPTDANSWFKGTIIQGGGDSALVAYQAAVLVPSIEGHQSLDSTNMLLSDVARNLTAYLTAGASSYARSKLQEAEGSIQREVDAEMRNRHLDPDASENKAVREELLEKYRAKVLARTGLPGPEDFLFDANTGADIFYEKFWGYGNTEEARKNFLLAERPGLTYAVLDRAIAYVKSLQGTSDPAAAGALGLLEQLVDEMTVTTNTISAAWSRLQTRWNAGDRAGAVKALFKKEVDQQLIWKRVRGELYALSYGGDLGLNVKNLSPRWVNQWGENAARVAAVAVRKGLYSLVEADGDNILNPPQRIVEATEERATQQAFVTVGNIHAQELASVPAEDQETYIKSHFGVELLLQKNTNMVQLERARLDQEKAQAYKPKKDWLTRWRESKAVGIANNEMMVRIAMHGQMAPQEFEKQWIGFYSQALSRMSGLYIEDSDPDAKTNEIYQSVLEKVRSETEKATSEQLEQNTHFATYLSKASDLEKLKFKGSLYTENLLKIYYDEIVQYRNKTGLSALAPSQPGAWQKFRQRPWVRKSRVITRAVRLWEALSSDRALGTSAWMTAKRKIPFVADFLNASEQMYKTVIPMMTTGYAWRVWFWNLTMPYGMAGVESVDIDYTITMPANILRRIFDLQGWDLYHTKNLAKTLYVPVYSFFTMGSFFVTGGFIATKMQQLYEAHLATPMLHAWAMAPSGLVYPAAALGALALASRSREIRGIGRSLKKGITNIVNRLRGRSVPPKPAAVAAGTQGTGVATVTNLDPSVCREAFDEQGGNPGGTEPGLPRVSNGD